MAEPSDNDTEDLDAADAADDERRSPPARPPAENGEPNRDVLPKAVRQRLEAMIPELVKKTFAAGMGAVFTTEEGIRRIAKDVSLPTKDVANYLASTAGNTKDEVLRIIAREVREFLESVNLSEEIAKMLTTLSFEIKTEIRFIPNDERYGSVKPDVKSRVRLRRGDDKRKRRRRRRRRRDDYDDPSLDGDDSDPLDDESRDE